MKKPQFARGVLLFTAVTAYLATSASAQVARTWSGGTGYYYDPSRWTGGVVPGGFDTAVFNEAGSYLVLWDTPTGNTGTSGVRVNGGDVTLQGLIFADPRSHTAADLSVNHGRLQLVNFTLNAVTGGTLTIDNSGRLDVKTGATLNAPNASLAMGSLIGSGQNELWIENGVVNLRDAYLANYATGDSSTGFTTVTGSAARLNLSGDLYVDYAGKGTLTIRDGAAVTSRDSSLGVHPGWQSFGAVTVAGNGAVWNSTNNVDAGGDTGWPIAALMHLYAGGRMNVGDSANQAGLGMVVSDADVAGGNGGLLTMRRKTTMVNETGLPALIAQAGCYGRVEISGLGSLWINNAPLVVASGPGASGSLKVSEAAQVAAFNVNLGEFGGTANVTVANSGSALWAQGDLNLGTPTVGGTGTLTSSLGGTILVGDIANASNVPGSLIVSDIDPAAANAGGRLSIYNGSVLNHAGVAYVAMAANDSGAINVHGAGSTLSVTGIGVLGNLGTGTMNVSQGGRFETQTGDFVLANGPGAVGVATVDGANSICSVGGTLQVGGQGNGTLNITGGGKVTASLDAALSVFAGGTGRVNLSGAGSTLAARRDLVVGNMPSNGTSFVMNPDTFVYVGDNPSLSGAAFDIGDSNLDGTAGGNAYFGNGVAFSAPFNFVIGEGAGRYGRLTVLYGGSVAAGGSLFTGTQGVGYIDALSGGVLASYGVTLGGGAGGRGIATVDGAGSQLDVGGFITVGNTASIAISSIDVQNGGRLTVGNLAANIPVSGAPPLVQVDISDTDPTNATRGFVTLTRGARLWASAEISLGHDPNSNGRIDVGGVNAEVRAGTEIDVGYRGHGTLNVTGGALVQSPKLYVGRESGALGAVLVSGSGSRLNIAQSIQLGPTLGASSAVITIAAGGTVTTPTVSFSAFTGHRVDMKAGGVLLIQQPSTYEATVRGLINLAYASGAWNNLGITSTDARANSRLGVGYRTTAANLITIKLVQNGDTDLDGTVNFADLLSLAQNYGQNTGKLWSGGDFNYDGAVGFGDLLSLAQNYGMSALAAQTAFEGNGLSAAFLADFRLAQSLVPEPTSLASLGCLMLAKRRRA